MIVVSSGALGSHGHTDWHVAAPDSGLLEAIARSADAEGFDLTRIGLAWVRIMPTLILVPAFGLRATPTPVRGALGLLLALCVFPAVGTAPALNAGSAGLGVALLVTELLRGIPVAVAAAVPLWAAMMVGGLTDDVRADSESVDSPVGASTTRLGRLMSILSAGLFLATGGASRVVAQLVAAAPAPIDAGSVRDPALRVTFDLVRGIDIAVAVGAPVLAAAVFMEVFGALVARAATPAQVQSAVAPAKGLGVLIVFGLSLHSMMAVLQGAH
jgi:type III secretory pathway component EscT